MIRPAYTVNPYRKLTPVPGAGDAYHDERDPAGAEYRRRRRRLSA